jgi:hypothetical protein
MICPTIGVFYTVQCITCIEYVHVVSAVVHTFAVLSSDALMSLLLPCVSTTQLIGSMCSAAVHTAATEFTPCDEHTQAARCTISSP